MRRTELDLCRILGCLMVLVIHAGAEIYQGCPIDSPDFIILNFISTAVRSGVPIFFMLSGALMLSKEHIDVKKHLKNHALYLTGIFFLWSFAYALLSRIVSGEFGTLYDFVYSVVAGHYHMWFIPAMVICYLFMPPAHALIHGERLDAKYLLGLFFGLVLLTSNMNLTPDTAPILHKFTLNFSLDWLVYMGYVIWGWWLTTKKLPEKTLWLAPLVFLLCAVATSAANQWYSGYKGEADGWLFSYFSLPNFIQATALFCFFLSFKDRKFKRAETIRALADCTLGVYLLHPLMINLLELLGIAVTPQAPVSSLLALLAVLAVSCFALTALAKRIPIVRKLL